MSNQPVSLSFVYEGWEGYQTSIVHAVAPLSREQLEWRPAPNLRSVGETTGHIAFGRIGWFAKMDAPRSRDLLEQSAPLMDPGGDIKPVLANDSALLLHWLDLTWGMIDDTLKQWTVPDLFKTYRHVYWGKTYAVSYQWTIWRIMCHDIQHGGQLAQMLGMQGLEVPELGDLGGHLTEPPVVED